MQNPLNFGLWPLLSVVFLVAAFSILKAQPFSNETISAGIDLMHDGLAHPELMGVGSGAAWLDADNDGLLDFYVSMRTGANKLYINNGDGTFSEKAALWGVQDATGDGSGVAVADFNNDGTPDIYLANCDEDRLFKNVNHQYFVDITAMAGFDMTDDSRGTSASWGDYNDDGFLDLFVVHHMPVQGSTNAGSQDRLYRNNGDETFTDVSDLLDDTGDISGTGFIGGWTDFDNNGTLDLILINDCVTTNQVPVQIFRNDGDTHPTLSWKFTEVSQSVGVDICPNGMGIAVGDYNHDGWMDFYFSNVGPAVLYKNEGGSFADVTTTALVGGQTWPLYSWGTSFFDYDNDGWQDLILALGSLAQTCSVDPQPNMLFRNNGAGFMNFNNVSAAMNMNDTTRSRNAVFGDYDGDGDLDVLLVNYGEKVVLKKNNIINSTSANTAHHFLRIDLKGTISNRDGIGARLELTTPDGITQYFETRSGSNLGGGDELYAHFGLGSNTGITQLKIIWPSGTEQLLTSNDIPWVDQMISVIEPGGTLLDVELLEFYATPQKNSVSLTWRTASEQQNDHFVVEKSPEGREFQEIGLVSGHGTSLLPRSYSFEDKHPFAGSNYYRLRQTDLDLSVTFSRIISVDYLTGAVAPEVFPNPVTGHEVRIRYPQGLSELGFSIFDALGRLIEQGQLTAETPGRFSLTTDKTRFPNGLYFLRLRNEEGSHTVKLLLSRH